MLFRSRAPSSSPNLTPWRNGSGKVFTVDKCGVGYSAGVIFNEKRKGRPGASLIPGTKNWAAPDPVIIDDVHWHPSFAFALKLPYLVNPDKSITWNDDDGNPVTVNSFGDFYKIRVIGYDDNTSSGVFTPTLLDPSTRIGEWTYTPSGS